MIMAIYYIIIYFMLYIICRRYFNSLC